MTLCIHFWIAILIILFVGCHDVCKQKTSQQMDGDVMITALLGLHYGKDCLTVSKRSSDIVQVAVQSVHLINKDKMIPGVKFGLQIYDTCYDAETTRKMALKSLIVGNYSSCSSRFYAGFIGPLDMESSLELSLFLNPFGIPHLQLSPNGLKSQFRNVLQMGTNSMEYLLQALLGLLREIQLDVVSIMYSNDLYGKKLLSSFKKLANSTLCVSAYIELNGSNRNGSCELQAPTNLILLTSEQSTIVLLDCLHRMNLDDTLIISVEKSIIDDLKSVNCAHMIVIEEIIEDTIFQRDITEPSTNSSLVNETSMAELPLHNVDMIEMPLIRKMISSFYLIAEALRQLFKNRCAWNSVGLCHAVFATDPSDWTRALSSTSYVYKKDGFKGLTGKKVGFGRRYFSSYYMYLLLDDSEELRQVGYFRRKAAMIHPILVNLLSTKIDSKCSSTCNCLNTANKEFLLNNRMSSTPKTEEDRHDTVILRLPALTTVPIPDLIGYLVGFALCILVMIAIFVVTVYKTTSCKNVC